MNPYDHRPITFNGIRLAPAMMGVSIIECFIEIPDDVVEWLWRFSICAGVENSSPSEITVRAASVARNALLVQRDAILRGISERFPAYSSEEVYRQWIDGFTSIITTAGSKEISKWSVPGSINDPLGTPKKREKFLEAFEKAIERAQKSAEPDARSNGRGGHRSA
jgi:hypothetical protein